MRYTVNGTRIENYGKINEKYISVTETAKKKEEADALFDIMMEDPNFTDEVHILDNASGRMIRNSTDEAKFV